MKKLYILLSIFILLISCNNNGKKSDAFGNFEAVETIISAEAAGKLISFNLEEGQLLKKGDTIGLIDTIQLHLKKMQLISQRKSVASKIANILSEINVFDETKKTYITEKNRLDKLFKDGAATAKQLDDINGKISVVESQINSVKTQNAQVLSEIESYTRQIEQLQDQIAKSLLINPLNGTVLEKYAEPFEMAATGKALYKIADLSTLELRVYVDELQLPKIKIGQKVKVLIDKTDSQNTELEGEISWVSSQAEFTPKIIQTKEERVNLVYAVKVRVKNDGSLKIAMPGEIKFN